MCLPWQRWDEEMRRLDERLRPIATSPVPLGDLAAYAKAPPPPAVDRAGIRAETETLVGELIAAYVRAAEADRAGMRALLRRYRYFAWGAPVPPRPTDEASLRTILTWFCLRDLGDDTRDAILELQAICAEARQCRCAVKPLLLDLAAGASDENRHGMGSTRTLLLRAAGAI